MSNFKWYLGISFLIAKLSHGIFVSAPEYPVSMQTQSTLISTGERSLSSIRKIMACALKVVMHGQHCAGMCKQRQFVHKSLVRSLARLGFNVGLHDNVESIMLVV